MGFGSRACKGWPLWEKVMSCSVLLQLLLGPEDTRTHVRKLEDACEDAQRALGGDKEMCIWREGAEKQ